MLKSIAAAVLLAFSAAATAGPLTPPPGPVEPTRERVIDRLPFAIAEPGVYVVTRDLTLSPDDAQFVLDPQVGIQILASDVTIDLNGYTLRGITDSTDGISVVSLGVPRPVVNITIRNGRLVDWGRSGVDMGNAQRTLIEDVHVVRSRDWGIISGALESAVRRCTVSSSAGVGFFAGAETTFEDCTAIANGMGGFLVGNQCVLRECVARRNGEFAFRLEGRNVAENCVATSNAGNGFQLNELNVIRSCVAEGNSGFGVDATGIWNEINNVTANRNQSGGFKSITDGGNVFINNRARFNGGPNGQVTPGDYGAIEPGNDVAPISTAATQVSPVGNIED